MSDENTAGTEDNVVEMDNRGAGKRQRSQIAFPYRDLDEAVTVAKAIYDNNATNPCTIEQLAAWMKQSPTASTFRSRLSTAKLFGVVDSERTDAIRLTDIGRMVVDAKREREGRVKAFLSVPLYEALHNKFKGYSIPQGQALEKELVALGVAETLKATARRVFESSAEQAGFFEHGRTHLVMPGIGSAPPPPPPGEETPPGGGGGGGGGKDGNVELDLDPLLIALLKKIPPTEDGWPAAKRVRWFRTFAMNVSEIYDADEDSPVELKIDIETVAS